MVGTVGTIVLTVRIREEGVVSLCFLPTHEKVPTPRPPPAETRHGGANARGDGRVRLALCRFRFH